MKEHLNEFLEIAKNDIQEAKRIFFGSDFKREYLEGAGTFLPAYYEELLKGKNRNQILEEFLIYTKSKNPVTFEAEKDIYEFGTEEELSITLIMNGWGYEELSLESDYYVGLSKTLITTEFFSNNRFNLTLDLRRLPTDTDAFELNLKTDYDTQTVRFVRTKEDESKEETKNREIINAYMDFRLGKRTFEEYRQRTEDVLADDKSMKAELFRLQMAILAADRTKAEQMIALIHETAPWIVRMAELDEIYLKVVGKPEKEPTDDYLFEEAFHNYLLALYDHNPLTIKSSVDQIKELKKKGKCEAELLWMLLYLDEELVYSGKKQLFAIRELEAKQALPEYLKYEVCGIWNRNPLALKAIDSFTLYLVRYGLDKGILSKEVYDQFSRVLRRVDSFIGDGFYLLEKIYEKYPEPEYLQSICKSILRTGQWDTRYHHYFEKAIVEDLKMEGLFEAYIHTVNKKSYEPLNPSVLHYFSYSSNLSPEEQAYLYANAKINRDSYGAMAASYLQKVHYETIKMMDQAVMNDATCYLYQKYLPDIADMAAGLVAVPEILFKQKVTCTNKNMKYLVVKHFEKEQADLYHLEDGIAYPDIYSVNAICYFLDEQKDPHLGCIEWKMEKLWKEQQYFERCFELNPYHEKLLLKVANDYVSKNKLKKEEIPVAGQLLDLQFLSEEAKELILELLLNFYYEAQDYNKLESLLKQVRWDKIQAKNRTAIIEYFITQKLYDEAIKGLETYGYEQVDSKLLLEVAVYFKKMIHSQKSQFLLNICGKLTREDMVNVDILQYMQKFADPEADYALALWHNGREKDYYSISYTEKLLKTFAQNGGKEEEMLDVFLFYAGLERKDLSFVEKVIDRFGRWYFNNGKNLPEAFFNYLAAFYKDFGWTKLAGVLAFLHYYSKAESLSEEIKALVEDMIEELVLDNVSLSFFLKYEGKAELPKVLYALTYVTYRGRSGANPSLHIQFKRGGDIKRVPMYEILDGIYISSLRLFADERPDLFVTLEGDDRKNRKSLIVERDHIKSVGTKFHKINEITSMVMDPGVYGLMKKYDETEYIIDSLMEPWFK
ncbi:MAG: DUF5717 family protein [Lachnospiraceae bacterium]|nr:DUF5717 family protein [Lachnospiraceae bacterium]